MSIITNEKVYTWFINGVNKLSVKETYLKFKEQFEVNVTISETRLYSKLRSLEKKMKDIKRKSKASSSTPAYFSQLFSTVSESNEARSIKAAATEKEKVLTQQLNTVNNEKRHLKRKLNNHESHEENRMFAAIANNILSSDLQASEKQLEILQSEAKANMKQAVAMEKKVEKVEAALIHAEKSKEAKVSSVCGKLRDAKEKIQHLEKEKRKLASLNETLEKNFENLQTSTLLDLEDLRHERHKLQKRCTYTKRRLLQYSDIGDPEEKQKLENEVQDLSQEVFKLQSDNAELQKVIDLAEKDEIVTFQDGKYTNEIREVMMELLNLNVSMNKINEVITAVVTKLGSQKIGRLPSAGAKSRILQESLILAQKQVGEAMLEGGIDFNTGNTIHGDGTSKFHRHFQNFQVTTKSGRSYSFGLTEVASGDVGATMAAFCESVEDLAAAINGEQDHNYATLVASIKTTMSDLGPVNPGFNDQLKLVRETLLPKAIENWDTLNGEQRQNLVDMANFFCKVHVLVNFASECDKVLKVFEEMMLDDSYSPVFAFKSKESCGVRLVRTACKAFHSRGCEKSGVASHFSSFLSGMNVKCYLQHFVGNRFNILFYNAAAVYFHKEAISSFIGGWPDPNNLLKAVSEDINNTLFLAEVRALGIIDKVVTGPLWRLIEGAENILALNPHLNHLKMQLSDLSRDASPVLLRRKTVFSDTVVEHHRDELFEKLFEPTTDTFDVLTQQCLEVLFHACLLILERQCADQLPGGKYWKSGDRMEAMAQNVPTTNKLSEGDFGVLDLLMRTKPNASCQAMLALTMWSRNGTVEWLNSLPQEKKEAYINDARHQYPAMKERYKKREKELKEARYQTLVKKQGEKQEDERKKNEKKINAFNTLLEKNMKAWISYDDAVTNLDSLPDGERAEAILVQMNFYRYVIGVKCPVKLFTKTCVSGVKRIDKPWEDLLICFQQILDFNKVAPERQPATSLKPSEVRTANLTEGKAKFQKTIDDARLKRLTNTLKAKCLQKYLDEPGLLVNKVVQHCITDTDGERWCKGVVTEVAKHHTNSKRTVFTIQYDSGSDNCTLLVQLEKGNLLILDEL